MADAWKTEEPKETYIRGGKLINLGKEGNDKWTMEILRLKYLDEFNMNWNELQTSFPKLIFLEMYKTSNAGVFEYSLFYWNWKIIIKSTVDKSKS